MRRPGRPRKASQLDYAQLLHLAQWGAEAACVDSEDKDAFFDQYQHEQIARSFCSSCPVRRDCLQHALQAREWGTWGGAWVPHTAKDTTRMKTWEEALRGSKAA